MKQRTARFLVKLAFQTATLAMLVCTVNELGKIHNRLKDIEKYHETKHRKLL